jgi:glycerol-3-phosphate cytidylyltransferase
MKVGFTCGAFDVIHPGHILMLQEAKMKCDYLIVGLQVDPNLDRPSKNKPIQTLEERKIMLEAIKGIDEIVVYETEKELYELLKKIQPHVRIIGADWKGKEYTGCDLPIKMYFNTRDHNWSSSELRRRIYNNERRTKKS